MKNHPLVRFGQLAAERYQRADVGGLSAALAYYALFSIFPLLMVTISVVNFFVDPTQFDVEGQVLGMVGSPQLADLVAQTLASFQRNRLSAGLVGLATLIFAATGIFAALNRAFDVIWDAKADNGGGLRAAVLSVVLDRLVAFGLLLACAALILASILGNFALSLLEAYTDWLPQSALLMVWARRGLTIAALATALAVIYWALPRPHAAWRDVWPAALLAAIIFAALQALAEWIFSLIDFSSYGALGGAMTLLMWIFFCGQIILGGGVVSYAWAYVFGSRRALEVPVVA